MGIIVGEGPVEGGDVQAAVGPGEQAQPSLAGGGVASGSLREIQALGDTLHQHCSAGRGRGAGIRHSSPPRMEDCVLCVPVVMIL